MVKENGGGFQMYLADRIVSDPEIVHGRPRINGTRMRVSDVLDLLAHGASISEIVEDYPYVTVEDIQACIKFAAAQSDRAILAVA